MRMIKTMSTNTIERTVMRRVRIIHTLKTIAGPVGKTALFALALAIVTLQVSVPHVIANMPSLIDVAAVARFFLSAFTHTVFLVQAFSLVAIATLLWLLRDLLRGNGTYVPMRA